jgi:hypothetical protein
MNRHVGVSLLKTSVLGNELKVVASHHDGVLHLVTDDHALNVQVVCV